MGKSYNVKLSIEDIKALLFKRKTCKICNGKLIKVEEYNDIGKARIRAKALNVTFVGDEVDVKIRYKCTKCGKIYGLDEL